MATQAEAGLTTTPAHAANLALKKRFVAALGDGDWDTGASLMHPDFELREPDALPYGGTYKGIEGFKQCLGSIAAAHKTTQMETLHTYFASDPDRIIGETYWRGVLHASGREAESKVIEQFEFRDGKILAITVYWFNIPDYS